jgi:hypothetical protein
MNTPQDATLEISYPKALLVTIPSMACFFFVGLFVIVIPTADPLLTSFFVAMVIGMTFVFAGCLCFVFYASLQDWSRWFAFGGADILPASAALGGHFNCARFCQPILRR